jgi:WhiB family transcriptional regulator, redox-sensing transcriptional regulator
MSTATLLAALSTDVGSWQDEGACARGGADVFFARLGELDRAEREDEAKARCAMCPVLAECFEWVVVAGNPSGVWAGGTNAAEREAGRVAWNRQQMPVAVA